MPCVASKNACFCLARKCPAMPPQLAKKNSQKMALFMQKNILSARVSAGFSPRRFLLLFVLTLLFTATSCSHPTHLQEQISTETTELSALSDASYSLVFQPAHQKTGHEFLICLNGSAARCAPAFLDRQNNALLFTTLSAKAPQTKATDHTSSPTARPGKSPWNDQFLTLYSDYLSAQNTRNQHAWGAGWGFGGGVAGSAFFGRLGRSYHVVHKLPLIGIGAKAFLKRISVTSYIIALLAGVSGATYAGGHLMQVVTAQHRLENLRSQLADEGYNVMAGGFVEAPIQANTKLEITARAWPISAGGDVQGSQSETRHVDSVPKLTKALAKIFQIQIGKKKGPTQYCLPRASGGAQCINL